MSTVPNSTLKFIDSVWSGLHRESQDTEAAIIQEESKIISVCCEDIKQNSDLILRLCKSLAELDIAVHAGIFSRLNNYVRPIMTNEKIHNVVGGRHPVVESFQTNRGNAFVSNDCLLNDNWYVQLLTGPVDFNLLEYGRQEYFPSPKCVNFDLGSGWFICSL